MSLGACPNWPELLSLRFESSAGSAEPEGLAAALAHFDSCPACRREACRIDPTLVFRRLPAAELDFAVEAERMRLAVAGMRASERFETRLWRRHAPWTRLRGRGGRGVRWAAAAALVAASLFVGGRGELAGPSAVGPDRADLSRSPVGGAQPARYPAAPRAAESAVEDLGRPDARIYQLDGDRLSVVMIVDESLDV